MNDWLLGRIDPLFFDSSFAIAISRCSSTLLLRFTCQCYKTRVLCYFASILDTLVARNAKQQYLICSAVVSIENYRQLYLQLITDEYLYRVVVISDFYMAMLLAILRVQVVDAFFPEGVPRELLVAEVTDYSLPTKQKAGPFYGCAQQLFYNSSGQTCNGQLLDVQEILATSNG